MTHMKTLNDAVSQAHIREIQRQNAQLLAENATLRLCAANRENQLVRFYTRKLRLTRWLNRLSKGGCQ